MGGVGPAWQENDCDPGVILGEWADRYEYGQAGGCWVAIRLYESSRAEPLAAATPEGLEAEIARDWATRSVT